MGYWILNLVNININVRNACVFLGPVFAGFTALSTYMFTKEVTRRPSAGLLAAIMIAIVPSYISRSATGSFDNEALAIWALVTTFWLWITSVNTGSMLWSSITAVFYATIMVSSWGGYIFIANLVPIHTLMLILAGKYSPRLYVAYSTFYTLGSIMAIQVPFVGFNIATAAENAATHGVFIVIQAYALVVFLREHIAGKTLQRLFVYAVVAVAGLTFFVSLGMQLTGKIQWTGRSLSLLDPSYAKKYLPIIASVSEHQPTTWSSFFFDLHILVPLAPAGLFYLYRDVSDAAIFTIIYGTIAWYFAGVMVRLMLTLAPIACILGGIAISELLHRFASDLKNKPTNNNNNSSAATNPSTPTTNLLRIIVSIAGITVLTSMLMFFTAHCAFVAREAYSSPSIVMYSYDGNGNRFVMDDFREAYYWLRQNTHPDAKIMSWWDYGYQTSALANRTTIVDNNTANNTHIACVGRAMASSEDDAYPILLSLDVDYVLVLFGGLAGYSSDDINKFLWMVRIGGGVFPQIQEADYFAEGQYRMDAGGSPVMLRSLMYRLSYYRYSEVLIQHGRPQGFDRVRQVEVGVKNIVLEHLDEAFTSEHWIVRIYKVRKPANRPVGIHLANRGVKKSSSTSSGGSSSTSATTTTAKPEKPTYKYLGCVSSETMLGDDKVYGGGALGSNVRLARHDAFSKGYKYFAIARLGSDGHSFAFSQKPGKFDVASAGCSRPCLDVTDAVCGCSDGGCLEVGDYAVPPEEHNRRWVVYEVLEG
jgi:dolichyl-diphosphooligosaccharide--protein glycosyltransferase